MDNRFIRNVTDAGPPRAAKGGFPYPGHRNMAEVMLEESLPSIASSILINELARRGEERRRSA